jgi:hypothetical protein
MREGVPNKRFLGGTIFYGTVFLACIFEAKLILYPENGDNTFIL